MVVLCALKFQPSYIMIYSSTIFPEDHSSLNNWQSRPASHWKPSPKPPYYKQNQAHFQYAALIVLCSGALALMIIFWKCCRTSNKDSNERQTQTELNTCGSNELSRIPPPPYSVIYDPTGYENPPPYTMTLPKAGQKCSCSFQTGTCNSGYSTERMVRPAEVHMVNNNDG